MDDDVESEPQRRFGTLLAAVDLAFETTGADTPGWPAPHRGRDPLPEEYSRVTDVDKYRILDRRVDAWIQALADAGIAAAVDVQPDHWIAECRPPEAHLRVRRIEPSVPDALRILLATTLVDGRPFGLDIGICRDGERPVLLAVVPACGCDACDHGSADLLDELDEWILTVARGAVVLARAGEGRVTRDGNGWSATAGGDPSWLAESTRVPAGVQRWAGAPWV